MIEPPERLSLLEQGGVAGDGLERVTAHTAVHEQHDSSDIACKGRGQERDRVCDILGLTEIAKSNFAAGKLRTLFARIEATDLSGVDQARLNAIHRDPMLAKLL